MTFWCFCQKPYPISPHDPTYLFWVFFGAYYENMHIMFVLSINATRNNGLPFLFPLKLNPPDLRLEYNSWIPQVIRPWRCKKLNPPEAIFLNIAVARTRLETTKRHPRSTYGKRVSHHGKNSKPHKNRLSQCNSALGISPLGFQPVRNC